MRHATIETALDREVTVVLVHGEHDDSAADALRSMLAGLQQATRGVVVELGVTAFLDTSVLDVLIAANRRAHDAHQGFGLVVTDDSRRRETLEVTGLLTLFPVYGSRAEAVAAAAL